MLIDHIKASLALSYNLWFFYFFQYFLNHFVNKEKKCTSSFFYASKNGKKDINQPSDWTKINQEKKQWVGFCHMSYTRSLRNAYLFIYSLLHKELLYIFIFYTCLSIQHACHAHRRKSAYDKILILIKRSPMVLLDKKGSRPLVY